MFIELMLLRLEDSFSVKIKKLDDEDTELSRHIRKTWEKCSPLTSVHKTRQFIAQLLSFQIPRCGNSNNKEKKSCYVMFHRSVKLEELFRRDCVVWNQRSMTEYGNFLLFPKDFKTQEKRRIENMSKCHFIYRVFCYLH